ncbi:MAG: gamma-glutamyl-gamma-aminobutyrate hydrolase family protein [Oligoflexia bacterium]|nr:gamma-glutamyl-gamma-aminobutyrate hydrolase family protein [Oligoflexia bacterium]
MRFKLFVLLIQIILTQLWSHTLVCYAGSAGVNIGLVYSNSEYSNLLDEKDLLLPYRNAIEHSGGDVVVLTPKYSEKYLQEMLFKIQGLLIPGGDDIDPKLYHEKRNNKGEPIDSDFDLFEKKIVEFALSKKLPILGICRGEQLINVLFGGSLYQDIPSQYELGRTTARTTNKVVHRKKVKDTYFHPRHEVQIEKESTLYTLFNQSIINTNSYHHQGVKDLAPGFKVVARTEDDFVEAIEVKDNKNIMGVQFHPELLRVENPAFNKLFEWLVDKAKRVQ